MELTPTFLMRMIKETLSAPRAAAAAVLSFGFSPMVGWMALMLMAIGSTLLTHISFAMMPIEAQEFWGAAMGSPMRTAVLQWVILLISVHAIHRIGQWRRGKGRLEGAVILVAWLQFILLCVQVVQLVAQAFVPALADLLGILGLVLFMWLLTNFVAQLHGFSSLALTFVGIILTLVCLTFVLAFIFTLLFGAAAVGV
ncbi:YIP1 family protein (plasmid) [Pseudorhodobacter turbinis]|uniref:YIP1 family protein n=1 Tax=Pseudorhodobacter turbinis TaxID=2500533 RepID=A0A4P8EIX1_9RHOB|nr:Yip1 family protein [Pseudorhodobacter turbinis]QCO56917.1 YIP1 family protein [Pseudorhodobacter turbinis]